MSIYKRNLSSKSQNDSSIKDISLQYSIRYFTKQIFQRQQQQQQQQPLIMKHLPKSTKTLLIPVYHNLTSSKSTRTKRFINSYQHKPSIDNNNNNNKQLQCDDTNRTKRVSISSSTYTHRTPKMRMKCKSKKDILEYLNALNSPMKKVNSSKRSSTLKKHNKINYQTLQVDTRNISNKLLSCSVVNASKGKVIKKNLSSNNIHSLIHYNESQEQDNEHQCKILRHKLAVLKHQIEKHRIEKTKLETTITTTISKKQRIHTLQTEIHNYKKLISTYQKNCNELTKEIHTLQTKINSYK